MNIQIIENPSEIIELLEYGTSLPINELTKPFILNDIKSFNAKSIIIEMNSVVKAHALVFTDEDILYFGYVFAKNDDKDLLSQLIGELKSYAEKEGINIIRGPINIPTILYGFGFIRNPTSYKFVAKSITPQTYCKCLLSEGFSILFEEVIHETPIYHISPSDSWYRKFQIISPLDYEDLILNYKQEILELSIRNMPPSGRITPSYIKCFDSHARYIFKYGDREMICLVKDKSNDQIIGAGTCLPDCFNDEKKGILLHSIVVDKNFRKQKVARNIGGYLMGKSLDKNYNWMMFYSGADNIPSMGAAQKYSNRTVSSSLILQYISNHISG